MSMARPGKNLDYMTDFAQMGCNDDMVVTPYVGVDRSHIEYAF